MEGSARTRLVALVVLLVVAVPLAVVAVAGSGGAGEEPKEDVLRVERSAELPELLLLVQPDANVPDTAGGRRTVTLECFDGAGVIVASQEEAWPFTDTDRRTLDPHAHLPVNPARIGEVERCRLKQTEPVLEAPVR
jgi:hypothetical protein